MDIITTQIIRQIAQSLGTLAIDWLVSTLIGNGANQCDASLDWLIS